LTTIALGTDKKDSKIPHSRRFNKALIPLKKTTCPIRKENNRQELTSQLEKQTVYHVFLYFCRMIETIQNRIRKFSVWRTKNS
jgi:hypothetical protein